MSTRSTTEHITIRHDRHEDGHAVARLAALESRRAPNGPLLLAEVSGEVVAAMPLEGGPALADPFRLTADIVSLLEVRAAQMREAAALIGSVRPAAPRARILRAVVR